MKTFVVLAILSLCFAFGATKLRAPVFLGSVLVAAVSRGLFQLGVRFIAGQKDAFWPIAFVVGAVFSFVVSLAAMALIFKQWDSD